MKALHLADTHVGHENYGRLNPETGLNTRLEDFVRSLRFAFETAIDEEVDLVLFCGDAYRTCDPTPTHQREFARALRLLGQADIPILLVPGNHDSPAAYGKATAVEVFSALEIEGVYVAHKEGMIDFPTKSGPIQVACLPWLYPNRLSNGRDLQGMSQEERVEALVDLGAQKIQEMAGEVDPNYPAILAAHLLAAPAVFSGSEQAAVIGREPAYPLSALVHLTFDYIALGHVHKFQDLSDPSVGIPAVYPGSIERVDFGEEKDSKGFVIVDIQDQPGGDRTTEYRFVKTPARPFRTLEVHILEGEDPIEAILSAVDQEDLSDAVVRVIYDFVSPNPNDPVDLRTVKQALTEAGAHYIASILPRQTPREVTRRSTVSEEMGTAEALGAYLEGREDLEPIAGAMMKRAGALEAELEDAA